MWTVLSRLHELTCARGGVISGRTKNVGTIIEKLTRESEMNLARMQDIAGVRLVRLWGGYHEQDLTVGEIQSAFPGAKVFDRRSNPRVGYRAVHLQVRIGKYWAEIQVRTQLQDRWAQVFEQLGDRWGRQIRYGEPPNPNAGPMTINDAQVPPSEVIQYLLWLSDMAHDLECRALKLEHQLEGTSAEHGEALERSKEQLEHQRADVDAMFAALRDIPTEWRATGDLVILPPPPKEHPQERVLFVVVYQRSKAALINLVPFAARDSERARKFQASMEAAWQGDLDREVVLLESDSLEDLRKTHSRYFRPMSELAEPRPPPDDGG